MKLLVTGASGLIANRLIRQLLSVGHTAIAISRHQEPSNDVSSNILRHLTCDLSDADALSSLDVADVDTVVHCASQQPRSDLSWSNYYQGNVQTVDNVLNWMPKVGIGRLVFLSTVAFLPFPENEARALDEQSPVYPQNNYALSKYFAECLCELRARQNKINALALRLPSVFLEEQRGGVVDTYYSHATQNTHLELYSEGRYLRNLIYIDDVLTAIERSIAYLQTAPTAFERIHVGCRKSWTSKQVAQFIYKNVSSNAHVVPVLNEVPLKGHCVLDLTKAARLLGFEAQPLERSLLLYIERMTGRQR